VILLYILIYLICNIPGKKANSKAMHMEDVEEVAEVSVCKIQPLQEKVQ